jgi:8-oxo-dGTP pyrophosphatase MutT (NUDIX family)
LTAGTIDIRRAIRREIASIDPFDDIERQCQADVIEWIDSGAEIFRQRKPADPPQHLIAYCVLIDGDYVLLCDHINAQLWLPTGGHVDPGEHPRDTARREAHEELGVDYNSADIGSPAFLSLIDTVGKTAGHTDVCLWYVLPAQREWQLRQDLSEFNAIAWYHRDELPLDRTDAHLQRFRGKFFNTP